MAEPEHPFDLKFRVKDFRFVHEFQDQLKRVRDQMVDEVISQREEVLKAFIAKYGCGPESVIQEEYRMPDGTTRWLIRRMTDEEMAYYGGQASHPGSTPG